MYECRVMVVQHWQRMRDANRYREMFDDMENDRCGV